MDRETERTLARRARGGDREAFGELVHAHMQRAYFTALGLVGSHDDALDLSQDAFVRAFRARRRLDPERPFYPWLYRILRRLCFNHLRDGKARRGKLERAGSWLADDLHGRAGRDPAREVERGELRARLEEAIGGLPAAEREALVLREFQGLSYREIAELAEIPIGTVMSRLYRARRALAAALEPEEGKAP